MRKTISQRVSVGEQPRKADLEELKKDGVTTVVNLRVVGEETPLTPAEERALAEQLGLQYHHLPISLDNSMQLKSKSYGKFLRTAKARCSFIVDWASAHAFVATFGTTPKAWISVLERLN
jgi:protein tyrosine phosphatase (PTP) superfamily phosphohydrolase (DUF442 family)